MPVKYKQTLGLKTEVIKQLSYQVAQGHALALF